MFELPRHFLPLPEEVIERTDAAATLATEQQNMSIFMFNMLPTSVQSRLPALRSLRRSASLFILTSRRRDTTARSGPDVDEVTMSRDDAVPIFPEPVSEEKTASTLPSGVKWRYAAQGSYLHHSAAREKDDPGFARRSYIDGVAYILKSLPDDLDDHESRVIRQALPRSCAPGSRALESPTHAVWQPPPSPDPGSRTLLRRGVAALVSSLVALLHVLLSLAVVLVRVGAQCERQYRISQHLVSWGFAVGHHGVVLSGKICAMSDGRVGRALAELAAWTVENVTAGIQDGIGQGRWAVEQKQEIARGESRGMKQRE
ncbi:hypothetical protein F4810DRAFT_677758 [Camillea tinctor]|nr:hypothetical protein F4810DRAFT_677758 [Camillea tinctor]